MNHSQAPSEQVSEAWRRHRPYLVNLGYQIIGDVGDAEDVAQEAFLRLSRTGSNEIDDVRGWLTVVTTRLCLDQVRSARARYAFVLHDVFGVPFDTIAETVGRPVGTCRQLARRARGKFATAQPKLSQVASAEHQLVTEKFITACANGDIASLTAVLDPTVWGVGTILADPAPPPQVNHGPHNVATNLLQYLGPGVTLVSGPAGQAVLLAFADRRLFAAIVLTVRGSLIAKIEAIADPAARA